MRRKDKEITDQNEIEDILRNNNICRIAYSENNTPYITVMNYGYSENKLYFHCAKEGRKLDIIEKNNIVCFEITDSIKLIKDDQACNYSTIFRSLVGYGEMIKVTDADGKKSGLDALMKHVSGTDNWEYDQKMIDAVTVLCLCIKSVSGKKNRVPV